LLIFEKYTYINDKLNLIHDFYNVNINNISNINKLKIKVLYKLNKTPFHCLIKFFLKYYIYYFFTHINFKKSLNNLFLFNYKIYNFTSLVFIKTLYIF